MDDTDEVRARAGAPGSHASHGAAGVSALPGFDPSREGLPDFQSILAVEKDTTAGGKLKFGLGALTFPDGRQEQAVAIEIRHPKAPNNGLVAQFSMLMPTFSALLEGMMEVFAAAQGIAAPTGDKTRSGLAAGKSPVAESDAPNLGSHILTSQQERDNV